MDLLTLAAAKNYTNKVNDGGNKQDQLIEKISLTKEVKSITNIEFIPAEKSETGKDEIRIYGTLNNDEVNE